jgi:hypothetical protein
VTGGHVDKKGKKNFESATMFVRGMSTPSLINLDSLIMNEEEVMVEVYLDEENSPQTPKRVNLVQLLDVKEK